MKEDEKRFLIDVYNKCRRQSEYTERYTVRNLINSEGFYMHHKRAWRILEKWAGKDWYEWGVTMDLGWLTNEGKTKAEELMKQAR